MEPVRILQVVTKMDRAGLETMLMNYYRNIDRNRVQFDFLVHRDEKGDYDDEILAMGGKIYHTYPIHPRYLVLYFTRLNFFFAEHPEYKIVHSHVDSLSAFPLCAAKKAGVPIRIAHSHSTDFDRDFKLPLRYLSKRMLHSTANRYWGCSKPAVQFMFGNKVYSSGHYMIFKNAIDSKRFSFSKEIRDRMREELGIKGRLAIGHVGRFDYAKNHDFLIDVFYETYKQNSNAVLLLIGDGGQKTRIQEKVDALSLEESVKFLGSRSDVPFLLQALDLFLLPSRYEGLPLVLVEAQAAGLPCMISDVVTSEVEITSGLVSYVPLCSGAESWAQKILTAVANGLERHDTFKEIQESGYDIVVAAKEYEEICCRLSV